MNFLSELDGYESSSSSGAEEEGQKQKKVVSESNMQPRKYFKTSTSQKQSPPSTQLSIPKPFEVQPTLPSRFASLLSRGTAGDSRLDFHKGTTDKNCSQSSLLPPQLQRRKPNISTEDVEQFGMNTKKRKPK